MKKNEIDAVDVVHRIRERHSRALKDKTPEERLAFYRQKAAQVLDRLGKHQKDAKTP